MGRSPALAGPGGARDHLQADRRRDHCRYHRLFTHRSFKTTRTLRALLAVLGSMAVEGPVIEWVATHRKHHLAPNRLIAVRRAREDSRCCDRAAVFELHRHVAHHRADDRQV